MSLRFHILLIVFLFFANHASAALSGTVSLTGAVPALCAIVVTAAPGATGIADISLGDTNRTIATVTESCNDPDGYQVTVAGTNSGDHTGRFFDPGSGAHHDFTITYAGVAVPVGGVVTDASAPGIGLARTVQISYPADGTLPPTGAFTYVETLTFTIAAK